MTSNSLQKNNNFYVKQNTSAILLINLDNVKNNYNFLRKKALRSEIGVSVKANAYGLGHKKLCQTLIKQGCNTFFVATAKEGLETIKIKKNLNVYLLNGPSDRKSTKSLIKKNIKIVINTFNQLIELIKHLIYNINILKINIFIYIYIYEP